MSRFKQKNHAGVSAGKAAPGLIAYAAAWSMCVLWFWLGMGGGGWIMAYTILSFGVILPIATLASAFHLEWKQDLGRWRWIAVGFFSVMYAAAMWATFVLSTSLGVANIAAPSPYVLLVGLCLSAIGIGLGWSVRTGKMDLKVPVIGISLLLAVCYVRLKTLNGSFFRLVLILDVPAALILILGLWLLFRGNRAGQTGRKDDR